MFLVSSHSSNRQTAGQALAVVEGRWPLLANLALRESLSLAQVSGDSSTNLSLEIQFGSAFLKPGFYSNQLPTFASKDIQFRVDL